MKFINRKDENGKYILSDAELVSMITRLDKKYDLSSTSYPSYFVWEITRDDEKLVIQSVLLLDILAMMLLLEKLKILVL